MSTLIDLWWRIYCLGSCAGFTALEAAPFSTESHLGPISDMVLSSYHGNIHVIVHRELNLTSPKGSNYG